MDQETFWLLMQVMFGDHHQRQKANFTLRRKGVANKIRLKAKHKGPGARLSLKRALRDAISKYEFRQRHSQHTASAFSTRTAQNRNYGSFAKPQSGRSSSGPPRMDPNAPMHSQGTISQYEPNFFGKIENKIDNSPFFIRVIVGDFYNTVDAMYMFFSLRRGNKISLSGELVTGSRLNDRMVDFTSAFMSSFVNVAPVKTLNAAQFSSKFKGSFMLKVKPKTRGKLIKGHNKLEKHQSLIYDAITYVIGFAKGI